MSFTYITDIKEALDSCLAPFFSGGNTVQINGMDVTFYDCEIKYGIDRLRDSFTGKPLIIIFSPTDSNDDMQKCNGSFVHEFALRSRIVVKVGDRKPLSDTNENLISSREMAHQVWGQLFLIINTQEDRFVSYNLRHLSIDPSPIEIQSEDAQEILMSGIFSYKYQITLSQDAFVAP